MIAAIRNRFINRVAQATPIDMAGPHRQAALFIKEQLYLHHQEWLEDYELLRGCADPETHQHRGETAWCRWYVDLAENADGPRLVVRSRQAFECHGLIVEQLWICHLACPDVMICEGESRELLQLV